MSRLYKRGRYWWTWGHDRDGARWFESTKVPLDQPKSIASKAARDIERRRLLEGQRPPASLLADALTQLREAKVRRGASEGTMQKLRYKGGHLLRLLGPRLDLHAVTLAVAEGYLDARRAEGTSLHTIAMELGTLRSAMRLAAKHGQYRGDVATWWPDALQNVYTPRDRWLTWQEWLEVLAVAPAHRHDHLTAYVHLGLRASELYRIEAKHLDYAARSVYVDGTKTKAAKRWIPCDADVWPVLTARAARHPSGPLFPERWSHTRIGADSVVWAEQIVTRRCEAAGLDPRDPAARRRLAMARWSPNDLRRTFASWLCQAGAPELEVTRLLGHTSSTMVRRVYAQMSGDALRRAIDRLPCRVTVGVTGLGENRRTG